MKKISLILLTMAGLIIACSTTETNPFFTEWETPYGVPPFDQIKNKHFMPAFEKAIAELQADIAQIAENAEAPTFENTIVAMDCAGALLNKVYGVFSNLALSDTDPEKQVIEVEIEPKLAQSKDDIYLNAKLFTRVKAVYEQREQLNLDTESATLLKNTYKAFERSGANLNEENQTQLRKINEELSVLLVKYAQNVLADNNLFRIVVDKEEDLSGLPASFIQEAAERAKAEDMDGKWVFTIDAASRIPFLQYADNRDLRKQMLMGYSYKGNNNNANNNKEVVQKIVSLQYQKAKLMGFPNYASFALDDRMTKTTATVNDFLQKLWE
ncbi:MAG: M3 family metallopeptidase, partial [Prevotellaceae bacterium]|nr:M3 family metallopeptidase [Prevotellaceae bacterium]